MTCDSWLVSSLLSDAAEGEALLHGVPERLNKLDPDSDTDIMVSDVNALNIPNHDVVAELFGVSLKSYKDIDDFTKGIELVTRASSFDPVVSKSTKSTSYIGVAGAIAKDQPKVSSNFCPLMVDPIFDGVNISIHRKVVKKISTRLKHTLYGYFIGKRMAFLKWSMDTRLLKEELTRILIWVKLHDVPIYVFEEDGISLIASFISKPIMLDSYTSSMCNDSWGRSSFARCLIEVNLEDDLVDVVTIGIPLLTRDGFTKETIRVEY
ncbi:zinc knuckle CX2CX4HX4C containing protein [Tanacetum coccineum]